MGGNLCYETTRVEPGDLVRVLNDVVSNDCHVHTVSRGSVHEVIHCLRSGGMLTAIRVPQPNQPDQWGSYLYFSGQQLAYFERVPDRDTYIGADGRKYVAGLQPIEPPGKPMTPEPGDIVVTRVPKWVGQTHFPGGARFEVRSGLRTVVGYLGLGCYLFDARPQDGGPTLTLSWRAEEFDIIRIPRIVAPTRVDVPAKLPEVDDVVFTKVDKCSGARVFPAGTSFRVLSWHPRTDGTAFFEARRVGTQDEYTFAWDPDEFEIHEPKGGHYHRQELGPVVGVNAPALDTASMRAPLSEFEKHIDRAVAERDARKATAEVPPEEWWNDIWDDHSRRSR